MKIERSRVERSAPLASERPTVTGEWRDTDQRRSLLAVQPPELGEIGEERTADDGPDAGLRAQEVLFRPPDRTLLNGVVEIAIDRGHTALERVELLLSKRDGSP